MFARQTQHSLSYSPLPCEAMVNLIYYMVIVATVWDLIKGCTACFFSFLRGE